MGDLVEVKGGDRIPADLRIISAHGCKVDLFESSSTNPLLLTLTDCKAKTFTCCIFVRNNLFVYFIGGQLISYWGVRTSDSLSRFLQ